MSLRSSCRPSPGLKPQHACNPWQGRPPGKSSLHTASSPAHHGSSCRPLALGTRLLPVTPKENAAGECSLFPPAGGGFQDTYTPLTTWDYVVIDASLRDCPFRGHNSANSVYAADIALDTSHSSRAHVTTHHDFSYFTIKLLRQTIAPVPLKISEACLRSINHNVGKAAHCMPSSKNIHSRVAAQHLCIPLWTGDRCTQRSQLLLWCVVFRSTLARYDVMPRCILHRVCSCALSLPPCACARSHACMLACGRGASIEREGAEDGPGVPQRAAGGSKDQRSVGVRLYRQLVWAM